MRRPITPRIRNGYVNGSNDIRTIRQIRVRRYGARSSIYSLGRITHVLKGKMFNVNYRYHNVVSSIRFGFIMYHANSRCGKSICITTHLSQSRTTR